MDADSFLLVSALKVMTSTLTKTTMVLKTVMKLLGGFYPLQD